ncbi:MAG TPA: MarR family transcriptional regulator [Candidatus Micrarchaeia archaeon]|nr:MarR family transcriptional regulator [Candidatus Micrarchaeia archaeon]
MIPAAELPRPDRSPAGPTATGAAPAADPALETWRLFLRAQALVRRLLADRLARLRHVPLGELEVLVQLEAVPEGRLRMAILADRVLLSRSGLTRRIERLERLGLVERQACPNDARGAFAVLTPAGRARSQEAAADHLAGISESFGSPLIAADGLEPLRDALVALVAAAEAQLAGRAVPCGSAALACPSELEACPDAAEEEGRYTDGDA